jgi:hypothetical protein
MSGMMSLLTAAAKFGSMKRDMDNIGPAIVAKACAMVCAEARRVLGVGYPEWPALSPATLADKMGPGPLLETGELRDSIQWTSHGLEGTVGSDNDKAVWHELGTAKIPARSFLVGAALHMSDKIHTMAGKAVVAVLGGRGLHSSEMMELIHLLKHVAHHVKELGEDLVDDHNNNGRHR